MKSMNAFESQNHSSFTLKLYGGFFNCTWKLFPSKTLVGLQLVFVDQFE